MPWKSNKKYKKAVKSGKTGKALGKERRCVNKLLKKYPEKNAIKICKAKAGKGKKKK